MTMNACAAIRYRIAPLDPHAHAFGVRRTVADADANGQRFRRPAGIPGSYPIRAFARHFVSVRAEGVGVSVAIVKEAYDLRRSGEALTVHAFRRDELIVVPLTLAEAPQDTCWMAVDKTAGDAERTRRDARLGGDATA